MPSLDRGHAQLVTAVQLLGAAPAPRAAAADGRHRARLSAARASKACRRAPSPASERAGQPDLHGLHRRLGNDYRVFPLARGRRRTAGRHRAARRRDDLGKVPAGPRPPPFWGGPWMMTLMFAVDQRHPARPVGGARLDRAAVVLRQGRREFQPQRRRRAAARTRPGGNPLGRRALNRMRERITGLIDDRTRMLAAISHDLRTPITRMRLRSEFIEDETHRSRMLADLDQMRSMLESVLSFLRNGRRLEAMTLVDIASTLQLVADQFADMGHKVAYDGPASRHGHGAAGRSAPRRHQSRGERRAVRRRRRRSASRLGRTDRPSTSRTTAPAFRMRASRSCWSRSCAATTPATWTTPRASASAFRSRNAIVLAHGGELSLHDRQPQG